MNVKTKEQKKQVITQNSAKNFLSNQEIEKRVSEIEQELKAYTWHELETNGKFIKNDKISFITTEMLIVGCDIGSEMHFIRAIDNRGIEISKAPLGFTNDKAGFEKAKQWMLELAAQCGKTQIVLGLEPTGHYWFALATWLISHGVSVVQVNPYAVKQSKEIEDNSQLKDDRKDPKIIANLVKDGNYGMPYLPEKLYADLRRFSMFHDQLTEDRIRYINRLHRELKIYFPEYVNAFGKPEGTFALELLKVAQIPKDIVMLGEEGIRDVWHNAKLRGRGYNRAKEIVEYAKTSVGVKEGMEAGKSAIKWNVTMILEIEQELAKVEAELHEKCKKIPNAENLLEIKGVGENILAGIIAEMGDIERFDDAKEIQKLSGLSLVASSSGKHNGQTRISYRGRKRLRYWLFQATKSAVAHADEYKQLHEYYTTRTNNPLKKKQSLIVIACKILRVIYAIIKTGAKYNPEKMLSDIKRPKVKQEQMAA